MRLAWEKIVNPPASLLGQHGMSEMVAYFFDSVLKGKRGKYKLTVDEQKKFVHTGIEIWDYLNDKVERVNIMMFLCFYDVVYSCIIACAPKVISYFSFTTFN